MADRVRAQRADDGFTLLEVMVATTLMTVVTAITTTAIVQIYRSVNETDAESEAQSQVTAAFRRLDREIRYARDISEPGRLDGDHYVEYLVELADVDTCVQLRLRPSTRELQRRQWTLGADPLTPTAWTTLAALTSSTEPFTVTAANPELPTGFRFQRLRVYFTATAGSGQAATERVSDMTFTALNATREITSDTCTEARGLDS